MKRVWKTVFSQSSFCIMGIISLSVHHRRAANVKWVWDAFVHKTGESATVWEKKVTLSKLFNGQRV